MHMTYGVRDIVRNPSLLKIDSLDSYFIEDKKSRKRLGVYLGVELADQFFEYTKKQELLKSAHKIKQSAKRENILLDESIDDEL